MIPREVSLSEKKALFQLSELQEAVLVGTLLGDANLRYRGKWCRLHIKHAASQLPLVRYKRKIFEDITKMGVREFSQRVGIKDYNFAELVTLTHPIFSLYYELFYREEKKVVPQNISNLLVDPRGLAVWLMDDGSAEYAGASLQTHGFSLADVTRLMKAIQDNFGIKVQKRRNKGKWIIYFPKSSMEKLKLTVQEYVLPEFRYKLQPYSIR